MWRLAPSKITRVGWRLLAITATGRVCRPDPPAPGVPAAPVRSSRKARTRAPSAAPNSAIAPCVWWKLTSTSSTPVVVYIGGGPPLHPGTRRKVEAPHLLGIPGAVADKGAQEFSPIVSNFNGEKAALSRESVRDAVTMSSVPARPQWSSGWGASSVSAVTHSSTRLVPQGYGRLTIDAQEAQRGIGGHQQSRAARNKEFGHPVAIDIRGAVEILPG